MRAYRREENRLDLACWRAAAAQTRKGRGQQTEEAAVACLPARGSSIRTFESS